MNTPDQDPAVQAAVEKASKAESAGEAWKWVAVAAAALLATPMVKTGIAELGKSSRTKNRCVAATILGITGAGAWFVIWALEHNHDTTANIVLQAGLPALIAAVAAFASQK